MKAIAFLISLCLGSQLAWGDAIKARAYLPRPKPEIIDLDFSDDESAPKPAAPRSHGWIFWTLGATLVAGGLSWYWYAWQSKPGAVVRDEEVFTDERP